MNSGVIFGYVLGSFIGYGLLPAAFILYGRHNQKSWALVSGTALAMLFGASWLNMAFQGQADFWSGLGAVLGWVVCAMAFFAKPKVPPTSTDSTSQ